MRGKKGGRKCDKKMKRDRITKKRQNDIKTKQEERKSDIKTK